MFVGRPGRAAAGLGVEVETGIESRRSTNYYPFATGRSYMDRRGTESDESAVVGETVLTRAGHATSTRRRWGGH